MKHHTRLIAAALIMPGLALPALFPPQLMAQDQPIQQPADKPELNQVGLSPVYQGELPSLAALNVRDAKIEEVLTGLEQPWAFEFISPGEVIITEISGRLSRFRLDTREVTSLSGLPVIVTSHAQTGLLDVALHPDFIDNRRIYLSHVVPDNKTGRYFATAVSTAILNKDSLDELELLFVAEPFAWSPANFGGAMEFDAAGHLYITVGDRSEDEIAQRGDRLEGKILRLRDDGSIPADNPFVSDDAFDDRIYALGVRNPQGLYYDSQSNRLFEAEHGPLGGDEVNVIQAGANYGWPTIGYGKYYSTESIGEGTHKAGMQQPLFYYLPSEAISPIVMYRGDMFSEWEGDLLVGALKGKHISKLDLDGDVIRSEYPMLTELNDRVRDIKVAPDGSVFVLLQGGKLVRLFRSGPVEPIEESNKGKTTYVLVCSGCHDTGADNAPKPSEKERWSIIAAQPREQTYQRAIDGFGSMPERGLCNICTDERLKLTVEYMLQLSLGSDQSNTLEEIETWKLIIMIKSSVTILFTLLLAQFWLTPVFAQDEFQPAYRATYQLSFEADWSAETHPESFPSNPHFSGLVGATHQSDGGLWSVGELATPGIQSMAETGSKTALLNEIEALVQAGDAQTSISGPGISLSPGVTTIEFDITLSHPLVSITSMIAPSPDWFVGTDSLSLRSDGQWLSEVVVELLPYDAGTDDGANFQSSNRVTNPPELITEIKTSPLDSGVPLGRFRFELLETRGFFPIAGHQSGWYYQPSRSGEGVNFNVAKLDDRLFLSVAWFTYFMGEQLWLFGSVDISAGDETATVDMYLTSGADFGDAFRPEEVDLQFWGTLTVSHPACGLMIVEWDGPPEFGSGELEMEQLVNVAGLECQ